MSVAQRWCHHELGRVEPRPVIFLVREEQIVRAGLGMNRNAPVAGFGHGDERLVGREVDHVKRHLRQFGQTDGAMGGFALHQRRARQHVVLRRGVPGRDGLLGQNLNDRSVLRMHADHGVVCTGNPHCLEQRPIIDHQHAGIGHEQLEACDTLAIDQRLHVGEALRVDVEEDHVGPDIDAGVGAAAVPVLEPDERALAAVLVAKVDYGRRAAKGSRLGSCGECVDRARCAELPIEMRVHIDPARQDQEPRGIVDGNIRTDRQVKADGMDAAVIHQDVRLVVVHRGDDTAVPDERRCHLIPLTCGSLKLRCGDGPR